MKDRWFDLALWRSPSSAWPDIVERRAADAWDLPYEVVQTVIQEHGETYVYKAGVNVGSWPLRWYWHVRASGSKGVGKLPIVVADLVKAVWQVFEEDGIDPVEMATRDALELVRVQASCEPGGSFACWCQAALAADVRAFGDQWNARRSAEARYRLVQDWDS